MLIGTQSLSSGTWLLECTPRPVMAFSKTPSGNTSLHACGTGQQVQQSLQLIRTYGSVSGSDRVGPLRS
jgi:hypothetical protein